MSVVWLGLLGCIMIGSWQFLQKCLVIITLKDYLGYSCCWDEIYPYYVPAHSLFQPVSAQKGLISTLIRFRSDMIYARELLLFSSSQRSI